MPLFKLKKVFEYCTSNKPVFLLVLFFLFVSNSANDFFMECMKNYSLAGIPVIIILIFLSGYGMLITRDRVNEGHELPKLMFKDLLVLGIKAMIVYGIFFVLQYYILYFTSNIFDFPFFDLEGLLWDFDQTINMFLVNEPLHSLEFVFIGGFVFYITTFFYEMGLAMLADTNSILSALNLVAIYKNIRIFGVRHYIVDYTSIVIAIFILTYLGSIQFQIFWFDSLLRTFFGVLVLATQYLGIGSIYAEVKHKTLYSTSSMAGHEKIFLIFL